MNAETKDNLPTRTNESPSDRAAVGESRFALPANVRLRRRADWQTTYARGLRASNDFLVLMGRRNELSFNRLGISIGRRYGNAVARNRFKRVCREAFRLTRHEQPVGFDWLVMPRFVGRPKGKRVLATKPPEVRLADFQANMLELMNDVERKGRRKMGAGT